MKFGILNHVDTFTHKKRNTNGSQIKIYVGCRLSVVSIGLLSSVALSQNLTQDYPVTTTDWDRAADAIEGGVSVGDALLPAPDPIRDMATEHREIWEALSSSSWSTGSHYIANPVPVYEGATEILGQMSDGTDFSMALNSFDHVPFEEALLLREGTDEFDFILENMISVAHTNGLVTTEFGEVLVEGIYVDWYEGEDRLALWLPLIRPDSNIFMMGDPADGYHCHQCQSSDSEALQQCFDDAETAAKRCLKQAVVLGGTSTAVGFYSGVVPGVIIGGATLWAINECGNNRAEDIETCLSRYAINWFVQDGYYHWDLR